MAQRPERERIGLPFRPFLYTLDQIATMLNVSLTTFKNTYVHYEGVSIGFREHGKMWARDIAPEGERPDWRIAENEFIRWCRFKHFKVYTRTSMSS